MPRLLRLLTLAVLACLVAAAPASAGSRFTIRGAGFGHGVGMSQYGAYGFAQHGFGYQQILSHYYTGTALGTADAGRQVRVLLQSGRTAVTFSGASQAGPRPLDPTKTYRSVRRGTTEVDLQSASGRRIATFSAPLQIAGADGTLHLAGRALNGRSDGSYRGILELRPSAFGLAVVNQLALDDYVRGVVSAESPSSWPIEALKAQAVAARTYAITTSRGGADFDQYPDTRSQMYGGVSAETPATDQAVAETAEQLVTYQGKPVTTYFFSTSGGRTEDVENVFGGSPEPWLVSVDDPYDSSSPRHRWGPMGMSLTDAGRRLGGLVRGSFRGIQVIKRGVSPRIVAAMVVGTKGSTRVTGATLRSRFGLYDTWAYYTSIVAKKAPPPANAPADQPPQRAAGDGTGGANAGAARMTRFRTIASIAGTVLPARAGEAVRIQRRSGARWLDVATARASRGGAYRAAITQPGDYRAVFRGDAGSTVTVR